MKRLNRKADRFDPILFISPDDPHGLDDCQSAAEAIVVREAGGDGKTGHFYDQAEVRIAAYMAAVAAYGNKDKGTKSMQAVADFLSNDEKGKELEKLMKMCPHWGSMLARKGHALGQPVGEELASIKSVTGRMLRFLNSQAIAESMSGCTFDPANFRKGRRPLDVFLVLSPIYMRAYNGVLRLWLDSLMKAIIRYGPGEDRLTHFLLDESASIMAGKMACVEDGIDKGRKYGIRLYFFWQSAGQLKMAFPMDQGQTMQSNTTPVYFAVNDLETATQLSKRLGTETILVKDWGTNRGTSDQYSFDSPKSQKSKGYSSGSNESEKQQARELLKTEEILSLPPRLCIACPPGMAPVWTTLLRYYEEPWLWKRKGGIRAACRTFIKSAVILAGSIIIAALVTCALAAIVQRGHF